MVTVTDVLEPATVGVVTETDVLDPGMVGSVALTGTFDEEDDGAVALTGVEGAVALTGVVADALVTGPLDDGVLPRPTAEIAAVRNGGSVSPPPPLVASVRPAPASAALPTNAASGTRWRRDR